jgi:hypothetical protein
VADHTDTKDIKIVASRPIDQKREFSNFIEFTANLNEVSLKFCDLKPPRPEELEKIKKEGKVVLSVNTEIVIPFVVAEEFSKNLEKQIREIREKFPKEEVK